MAPHRQSRSKSGWLGITALLRSAKTGKSSAAGQVIIRFDREDLGKEVLDDTAEAEILARLLPTLCALPHVRYEGSTWLSAEVRWRFSGPDLGLLVKHLQPWLTQELSRKGACMEISRQNART